MNTPTDATREYRCELVELALKRIFHIEDSGAMFWLFGAKGYEWN